MSDLTDRQRDIVAAIADLTARLGYPPTFREIAQAVGTTSTATVALSVRRLRDAEVLRPAPTHNRCVSLAPDVVVSRDRKIARVVWAETLGPVPRRITQNTPGHITAEGARIANDLEGVDGMTNPIDPPHAATRKGRQMTAAIAIAKACEHGLPDIHHWIIDRDQKVKGMVHSTRWLADLTGWAEYLAPDKDLVPQPRVNRSRTGGMATVEVTGTCHGVTFRIFHTATKGEVAEFRARRQAS